MVASTWPELGEIVVEWIDGKRLHIPTSFGPPDSEMVAVAPQLRRLCRAGIVVLGAQPGRSGRFRQRALLEAFGDQGELARIADRFGSGFAVYQRPLGAYPSDLMLDATEDGLMRFWDCPEVDEDVAEMLELADPTLATGCGVLGVLDLAWGRRDALWERIDSAIRATAY